MEREEYLDFIYDLENFEDYDDFEFFIEAIEYTIRKRFHSIINGPGLTIPRIAVKIAIDEIFIKIKNKK